MLKFQNIGRIKYDQQTPKNKKLISSSVLPGLLGRLSEKHSQIQFYQMGLYHLTASNEDQASSFRRQIDRRLELGQLPAATKYAVLPAPNVVNLAST